MSELSSVTITISGSVMGGGTSVQDIEAAPYLVRTFDGWMLLLFKVNACAVICMYMYVWSFVHVCVVICVPSSACTIKYGISCRRQAMSTLI